MMDTTGLDCATRVVEKRRCKSCSGSGKLGERSIFRIRPSCFVCRGKGYEKVKVIKFPK